MLAAPIARGSVSSTAGLKEGQRPQVPLRVVRSMARYCIGSAMHPFLFLP